MSKSKRSKRRKRYAYAQNKKKSMARKAANKKNQNSQQTAKNNTSQSGEKEIPKDNSTTKSVDSIKENEQQSKQKDNAVIDKKEELNQKEKEKAENLDKSNVKNKADSKQESKELPTKTPQDVKIGKETQKKSKKEKQKDATVSKNIVTSKQKEETLDSKTSSQANDKKDDVDLSSKKEQNDKSNVKGSAVLIEKNSSDSKAQETKKLHIGVPYNREEELQKRYLHKQRKIQILRKILYISFILTFVFGALGYLSYQNGLLKDEVIAQKEEIDTLNTTITTMQTAVDDINEKYNNEKTGLISQIETQAEEITKLNSTIDTLSTEIETLKTNIDTVQTSIDSIDTRVNDVETKENKLEKKVNALSSAQVSTTVANTPVYTQPAPTTSADGVVIKDAGVDDSYFKSVLSYYNMIPQNVRDSMVRDGWHVHVTTNNFGPTYGYNYSILALTVFNEGNIYISTRSATSIVHEIGHYIDFKNNWCNGTLSANGTYASEVSGLTSFHSTHSANYSTCVEYFAECYQEAVIHPDKMQQYCPNTYSFVIDAASKL